MTCCTTSVVPDRKPRGAPLCWLTRRAKPLQNVRPPATTPTTPTCAPVPSGWTAPAQSWRRRTASRHAAAVASGAAADPACLPNCDGENLLGRDLRFANMPDASLRFASLVIANLARADLSGADLSFANLARADLCTGHADTLP